MSALRMLHTTSALTYRLTQLQKGNASSSVRSSSKVISRVILCIQPRYPIYLPENGGRFLKVSRNALRRTGSDPALD